ncbi:MAG TPA: MFS transporter [Candidatus Limnocylindrales bacterium]
MSAPAAQPSGAAPDPTSVDHRPPAEDWRRLLVLYWITSLVEALGVSQIYAFLPIRLAEMGMPQPDIPHFVGLFSSLIFVFGLPIVPLWGVWADKYSRKAVIIRSALVEAVVFGGVAVSQVPWQLAVSMLLVGFQLGNTGVMLAALRDVTPRHRLGTAIAIFGASSPIGFGVGPAIGGVMIDGLHLPATSVYALSAALSLAVAVMLGLLSKEVRPDVVPSGRVVRLAFGAVRSVVADPQVRRLFAIYGTAFLARQMATPFLPLLVQRLEVGSMGLASAIALVVGTAPIAGAVLSSSAGWAGDRLGFRPVLLVALGGSALTVALMPFAWAIGPLAVAATLFTGLNAAIGSMVFGLLAVDVPAERRSATLNLVYLPLYVAGIVGPAAGAVVVTAGLPVVFLVAGGVLAVGAAAVLRERTRPAGTAARAEIAEG